MGIRDLRNEPDLIRQLARQIGGTKRVALLTGWVGLMMEKAGSKHFLLLDL